MKDSDVPNLTSDWWDKEKPADLKDTGLSKALKAFEVARKNASPKAANQAAAYKEAVAKLDAVKDAAAAAEKACGKTSSLSTCKTVLAKYPDVIAKERSAFTDELAALVSACKLRCLAVDKAATDSMKKIESEVQLFDQIVAHAREIHRKVAAEAADGKPLAGKDELDPMKTQAGLAQHVYGEIQRLTSGALDEMKTKWDQAYDKGLASEDKSIRGILDKLDQKYQALEQALKNVAAGTAAVDKLVVAVQRFVMGGIKLQDEYLAIAEDCDKRVTGLTTTVRGSFERGGGALENAKLDLINLKQQQKDPKQAKTIKPEEELKKIKQMIDEGESQVEVGSKALDKARTEIGSMLTELDKILKEGDDAPLLKWRGDFDGWSKVCDKYDASLRGLVQNIKDRLAEFDAAKKEVAKLAHA